MPALTGCMLQVLGGADLFLQGVIVPEEGLGSFSAGDLRVIKIPDNPYPFAVGLLEVSSADTCTVTRCLAEPEMAIVVLTVLVSPAPARKLPLTVT